ncbi:MAG: dihydroneopterin triphosphate diphosphatase [Burkholderiales bacterium]
MTSSLATGQSPAHRYKVPESVLVVIHTAALDVLLIRRADAADFWQSVTGSKDTPDEPLAQTAVREVEEETGIDCAPGRALSAGLVDWKLRNIYEIYPQWRHRYDPAVSHNTESLFALEVPPGIVVRLNPREHSAHVWLPWREAADRCFSPSNAEAILLLPRRSAASGRCKIHE